MATFLDKISSGQTFVACLDNLTSVDAAMITAYFRGPEAHDVQAVIGSDGKWVLNAQTCSKVGPPAVPAWRAGLYNFEVWQTEFSGVISAILKGQVTIDPSIISQKTGNTIDTRTYNAQMVDKLRLMVSGQASQGVRSYKINNRELERYSVGELLKMLRFFELRLAQEKRRAKGVSLVGPRIEVTF